MESDKACPTMIQGLHREFGAIARMDRRWRGSQGQEALASLRSFYEYKEGLPDLSAGLGCATSADVYSVYSCLHAAGKLSEVGCDFGGTFVYLQVTHQPKVRTRDVHTHTVLCLYAIVCIVLQAWTCRKTAMKSLHLVLPLWILLCQSAQATQT